MKSKLTLNIWPLLAVIFLLSVVISSCSKPSNSSTVAPQSIAEVTFIDVSPNAPTIDLYINSSQVNAVAIPYGNGLAYFNVYAGTSNVLLKSDATQQKLASDSIKFAANHYYTLFVSNSIVNPDFILLTDTLAGPASNQASVRFVNVSPNAPAVDLVIKGASLTIGNKGYKGYSSFMTAQTSINDTLQVRQTGTTNILATLPAVTLQTGGVYTVWLYGVNGATDASKLTLGIMTNANFY